MAAQPSGLMYAGQGDGGRPGFVWALLRTVLLLFVIPPLLTDRDLRGLHDRASDTIVVRM